MAHTTSTALAEAGYVVLDPLADVPDAAEWLALEYTPWRSSGITRFAPLTSYAGDVDCNAFWNHTPPRADKDGVWVAEHATAAPGLVAAAREPGANIGRCRVIELQPNTYGDAIYNLHRDDNNRLNPDGTGWVVRGMLNLTDDADSMLIVREDRFDPSTEVRLALPVGGRIVLDTERLWHAVWHRGERPRYALITSWESGPALDDYIVDHHGTTSVASVAVDAAVVRDAEHEQHRRIEERRRFFEAQGVFEPVPPFEDA